MEIIVFFSNCSQVVRLLKVVVLLENVKCVEVIVVG